MLFDMLEALETANWSSAGIEYGMNENLYTMPKAAADMIEEKAKQIKAHQSAVVSRI
jgi:hypothetical protein